MKRFKFCLISLVSVALSACGGGGSSSSTSPSAVTSSVMPVSAAPVTVSGKLTYDRVPHAQDTSLDYANTSQLPIRGVVVEALDESGRIMASTTSREDGSYQFRLNANTNMRVQIKANLVSNASTKWDVQITDNTEDNALYVLRGSLASTGQQSQQTRDIHAPHGWTGQSYDRDRSAAPFAILDTVYTTLQRFAAVDQNISFPELDIHWSSKNRTTFGDLSQGNIGSSAYHQNGDSGAIYILGQENVDTDEYDPHVIIHEWGHYFEHQMSRTDTIGGLHSLSDRLDPRVAFSEGWGNALSAIISNDPFYKDSTGLRQSGGFSFDVEAANINQPGWFTEASIGAILFDIYDTNIDDADDIAVGLTPLYNVMRSPEYRNASVFSTIFAFADRLRDEGSIDEADIDTLLEAHAISGVGPDGSGELNNGAIRTALPVYKEVTPNGETVQFCSLDDAGFFNKLGNRDFTFMSLPENTDLNITVAKISGSEDRDPDFRIWQGGQLIADVQNVRENEDRFQGPLEAGDYIIEAFDFHNINGTFAQRGDSCYDLTVEKS